MSEKMLGANRNNITGLDLSEMETVPRELFNRKNELAVSITDGYLAFNSVVMKQIEEVSTDEIVFDEGNKTISLMLPCDKSVADNEEKSVKGKKLRSDTDSIFETMAWDKARRYRAYGLEKDGSIVFDLSAAVVYVRNSTV